MASTLKKEVFVLYKRILRLGTTWKAVDPNRTSEERKYIIEEAKFWFRKNSRLADLQTIQDHIKEGEARFEMALHYRNPYPRPVNLPPNAYSTREGKKSIGKTQERLIKQSRPVYTKSLDKESGFKNPS